MGNQRMELREAREAKERVDDVGGHLDILLPVLFEHTRQTVEDTLVLEQLLQVVRIASQLENECRAPYLGLHVFIVQHLGIVVQVVYARRLVYVVNVGVF